MLCWMNGEFIRAEDLKISPFDHGFLYGAGFFETFRTYEGHVFLFKEHMTRLKEALTEFKIKMPYSDKEILNVIEVLNADANEADGYFRVNVSAGVHDIGLAPNAYETPNVIVFRKELPIVVRGTEKIGVWLETTRNQPESTVRQKSHNYLNNVRGRLELPSLKDYEGLFITTDGFVAEGVTSNVFWMKNDELFTPSIETGILPGTTRAIVMELAMKLGIVVNEGFYTKDHVEVADELFVTNAVQELVPIKQLFEKRYPGAHGEIYNELHELYTESVRKMKEGVK